MDFKYCSAVELVKINPVTNFSPERELQIQQDCEIGTQPRFVKWICWKRILESNGILLTS